MGTLEFNISSSCHIKLFTNELFIRLLLLLQNNTKMPSIKRKLKSHFNWIIHCYELDSRMQHSMLSDELLCLMTLMRGMATCKLVSNKGCYLCHIGPVAEWAPRALVLLQPIELECVEINAFQFNYIHNRKLYLFFIFISM